MFNFLLKSYLKIIVFVSVHFLSFLNIEQESADFAEASTFKRRNIREGYQEHFARGISKWRAR